MGIPRLRHHLLPFSQTTLLQGEKDGEHLNLTCIQSVVIDGPSLVYNVYSRLLSWFSESSSRPMEVLPTCDEVSCGVMLYLLQLRILGVEIKGIYFDGALPARKHETRVSRLESQRAKLELFCSETRHGFQTIRSPRSNRAVRPEYVLRVRPSPAKYSNVPSNPFMVSAVFEDLLHRWNSITVTEAARDVLPLHSLGPEDFSWADVTAMVPGEADAFCAYVARLAGSSVLTNDSDLLLYDLGAQGSVIFLDSVELSNCDSVETFSPRIKAAMLCPSLAARRLGIPNLLSFAFQLKTHPAMGMGELVRLSKKATETKELTPEYRLLLEEYHHNHSGLQARKTVQPPGILDTRISELFWQYEVWDEYAAWDSPHVYLPILNEDHTRRCAWAEGRSYRALGYSLLNLSRPVNRRYSHVTEFIRRGRRIVEDRVPLGDRDWIAAQATILWARLNLMKAELQRDSTSLVFWKMFALRDLYSADAEFTGEEIQRLTRFIRLGYMGKRLEWGDLHVAAQICSVLYSLRILWQLNGFLDPTDTAAMELRSSLEGLPPLHILMDPACKAAEKYLDYNWNGEFADVVHYLSRLNHAENTQKTAEQSPELSSLDGAVPSPKCTSNIYEFLKEF